MYGIEEWVIFHVLSFQLIPTILWIASKYMQKTRLIIDLEHSFIFINRSFLYIWNTKFWLFYPMNEKLHNILDILALPLVCATLPAWCKSYSTNCSWSLIEYAYVMVCEWIAQTYIRSALQFLCWKLANERGW